MFKTSAKFRMLSAFQLRRSAQVAAPIAANDNTRLVRRRPNRRPLTCRWSAVDGGARLACRWQSESDAPGPRPAQTAPPATVPEKSVVELSHSRAAGSRLRQPAVQACRSRT
jgi:hypothetical protein